MRGGNYYLQLDGGLAGVALHEVLAVLGADLGVGHVLALRHVALLLAAGRLLGAAQAVALVDHLTQTEKLLAANLAVPHPAPTPLGALKHGALHYGTLGDTRQIF